jgi:hypothetical protein
VSQEPVRTKIDDRVIDMAQRKADFYNRYSVSNNPLRPLMIQPPNMVPFENIDISSSSQPQFIPPLNMVAPAEIVAEPSSSQQPSSTNQT